MFAFNYPSKRHAPDLAADERTDFVPASYAVDLYFHLGGESDPPEERCGSLLILLPGHYAGSFSFGIAKAVLTRYAK